MAGRWIGGLPVPGLHGSQIKARLGLHAAHWDTYQRFPHTSRSGTSRSSILPAPARPPAAVIVVDLLPEGCKGFKEVCQQFKGRMRSVLSNPTLATLAEAPPPAPAPGAPLATAPSLAACSLPSLSMPHALGRVPRQFRLVIVGH